MAVFKLIILTVATIFVVSTRAKSVSNYDFKYHVSDPYTGDFKSQSESKRGDSVRGSYSHVDADGIKRTVDYTADAHSGYNAVLHEEPLHAPSKPKHSVIRYTSTPIETTPHKYEAPTYTLPESNHQEEEALPETYHYEEAVVPETYHQEESIPETYHQEESIPETHHQQETLPELYHYEVELPEKQSSSKTTARFELPKSDGFNYEPTKAAPPKVPSLVKKATKIPTVLEYLDAVPETHRVSTAAPNIFEESPATAPVTVAPVTAAPATSSMSPVVAQNQGGGNSYAGLSSLSSF